MKLNYLKILKKTEDKQERQPLLKSFLSRFKGLNWGFLSKVRDKLSLFRKLPIGALFVVLLIALTLTVLVANKLRMQHFANVIHGSYPELIQVPMSQDGNPIGQSPIDRVLAEFNAINAVGYLVLWAITFRSFLKTIWINYNPRKPQIVGRV